MTKKISTEKITVRNFHELAIQAAECLRTGDQLQVDPELIVEAGDAKTFLVLWKALRSRDAKKL